MVYQGKHYRTVWMEGNEVCLIDQTLLPFRFEIYRARTYGECCNAITTMVTRGAGAIGAVAGFAMALAFIQAEATGNPEIPAKARKDIESTRPTAQNLFYAVEKVYKAGLNSVEGAIHTAQALADENVDEARLIGFHGSKLIWDGCRILTHCNAGWLGFVDYGSALSPVYVAKEQGKEIFVYADETRPRGQGSRLTAWELANCAIEHAIIADHAAAYFMSKGLIDLVIVGADRVALNGDIANKIGTLEKAITARYYGIPFYVAVPRSTFDPRSPSGSSIVIEERDPAEGIFQEGPDQEGVFRKIQVCNPGSDYRNPAFDITPAGLITGLITGKGVVKTDNHSISEFLAAWN